MSNNFVLEVESDTSFFERNGGGRKVFRHRTQKIYFPFRSKNLKLAKSVVKKILARNSIKPAMTIDCHLYKEIN